MEHYISRLDEIDKWLFDLFGILPGACSSIENLRHTTARMVAEALWPKKGQILTPADIKQIVEIYDECLNLTFEEGKPAYESEEFYEEVLRRFNEQKGEK